MTPLDPAIRGALRLEPGEDLAVSEVSGGLFNLVLRLSSPQHTWYFKQFMERAKLGTFPPLPTSAWQRWFVARSCHAHAARCASQGMVTVPALVRADERHCYVIMDAAAGQPLYQLLIAGGASSMVLSAMARIMPWLARLHCEPPLEIAPLIEHSAAFRRFKVDLQYMQLLGELNELKELKEPATRFIERYLACHQHVLHGDLNSRNVLVAPDGAVAVIDFEQGQVGSGVYDVAYLLSELVIAHLRAGTEPMPVIDELWKLYVQHARPEDEPGRHERDLMVHLAFQVLYRLVGPSRQVWSGHLSPDEKAVVRQWASQELHRWLP